MFGLNTAALFALPMTAKRPPVSARRFFGINTFRVSTVLKTGLLVVGLCGVSAATAHVSFAEKEAAVGARFKGILQVPHGCKGSPTMQLTVQIPQGVLNVKPQPKAGWTVQTVTSDYMAPGVLRGKPVTSGVTEITWSGKLDAEHYDEFVFVSNLSSDLTAGQTLYFPVIQTCQEGQARWTDDKGGHHHGHSHAADHADGSAPALRLTPAK